MPISPPSSFTWPQNKKAAISITYDDALPGHHEFVAPFLESHGIRGTFYVPICGHLLDQTEAWRQVAKAGHELGNHTIFHPCFGAVNQDISWLDKSYNLRQYSARRWCDEIRVSNWALQQIDGSTNRSFANTCGNRWIGEGDSIICLDTLIPNYFVASRGAHTGLAVDPNKPNFANLGGRGVDGCTFDGLREELLSLRESGGWMIYALHGVGPRESQLFMEEEHRKLVEWLVSEKDFWVAPLIEIATWLKK